MSMLSRMHRSVGRLAGWWRSQVTEVPAELAACEFDCREQNCTAEMFDGCEHRLQHAAAVREAQASAVRSLAVPAVCTSGAIALAPDVAGTAPAGPDPQCTSGPVVTPVTLT